MITSLHAAKINLSLYLYHMNGFDYNLQSKISTLEAIYKSIDSIGNESIILNEKTGNDLSHDLLEFTRRYIASQLFQDTTTDPKNIYFDEDGKYAFCFHDTKLNKLELERGLTYDILSKLMIDFDKYRIYYEYDYVHSKESGEHRWRAYFYTFPIQMYSNTAEAFVTKRRYVVIAYTVRYHVQLNIPYIRFITAHIFKSEASLPPPLRMHMDSGGFSLSNLSR